jgi:hypothetical protein
MLRIRPAPEKLADHFSNHLRLQLDPNPLAGTSTLSSSACFIAAELVNNTNNFIGSFRFRAVQARRPAHAESVKRKGRRGRFLM